MAQLRLFLLGFFLSFVCVSSEQKVDGEKETIRQDGCAELSCAFDGAEIELLGSPTTREKEKKKKGTKRQKQRRKKLHVR